MGLTLCIGPKEAESFFLVTLTHGKGRHLTNKCENITNGWQCLSPRTKLKVRIQFELQWKWQVVPILLDRDLNQGSARKPWRLSDPAELGAGAKRCPLQGDRL